MAVTKQFQAIGTSWTIDLYSPIADAAAKQLFEKITIRIAEFDKNISVSLE
jgi:hypothetical protein